MGGVPVAKGVKVANSTDADAGLAEAHRELMQDKDIQWFLPDVTIDAPKQIERTPPSGGGWFGDLFGGLANAIGWLFWPLVILLVVGILFFIFRDALGLEWRFPWEKSGDVSEEAEPEWEMDEHVARSLLTDADALAAKGDYAGAAHLLLMRSVEDFATKRPQYMRPSLTSRDISGSEGLPERARAAFGHIARVVEASFFGGRGVDKPAWDECRDAYERYALRGSWAV